MVSTISDSDVVYERRTERVHKYHWPAIQLNLWMLFMLVASCAILGMFANFITIQQQLRLAVPWYVSAPPPPLPFLYLVVYPSRVLSLISNGSLLRPGTSPTT